MRCQEPRSQELTHRSSEPSLRSIAGLILVAVIVLGAAPLMAQTTTAGSGIDVEVYFDETGENFKCVAPGEAFWAKVWVRPGSTTSSCALTCSPGVPGGSANLATGIVDIAFDRVKLSYLSAENNDSTPAIDGLIQNNSSAGRIGWALAGDWTVNADPSSELVSPCSMGLLTAPAWIYRIQYQAANDTAGATALHLRRETDSSPFPLSFADICGSPAYKATNGGIDEIRDAEVLVSNQCDSVIFADSLEIGELARWSAITG